MPENRHSLIGEGTDVGLIGGLVVAAWFLMLDTIAGHPFQTPSLLGQMVIFGDRTPDPRQIAFGAILLYTAFHFIVFALVGMGLVALVHWGTANPVVRYALLPVFLVYRIARTMAMIALWLGRHHRTRRDRGCSTHDLPAQRTDEWMKKDTAEKLVNNQRSA